MQKEHMFELKGENNMAINIGHARQDENGGYSGGAAGDQTGKEVCVTSWYSNSWGAVLRCKDAVQAEKIAKACEAGCANNKIGYDQNQRNTLNTQAAKVNYDLSKITTACECDCSSFMSVCAQAAGINIPYSSGNAPTTTTMQSQFNSTGMFQVLTDSKYLTSDEYLQRGDILVKSGSHTAMALSSGTKAVQTFTIQYNANGGSGTMANTTVIYGVSTALRKNTFTKAGCQIAGWNAYKSSDGTFRYVSADGSTIKWCKEGSQPSGYTKFVYADQASVSATTNVHGDTIIMYAKWN